MLYFQRVERVDSELQRLHLFWTKFMDALKFLACSSECSTLVLCHNLRESSMHTFVRQADGCCEFCDRDQGCTGH